jgi:hypothetical protein
MVIEIDEKLLDTSQQITGYEKQRPSILYCFFLCVRRG